MNTSISLTHTLVPCHSRRCINHRTEWLCFSTTIIFILLLKFPTLIEMTHTSETSQMVLHNVHLFCNFTVQHLQCMNKHHPTFICCIRAQNVKDLYICSGQKTNAKITKLEYCNYAKWLMLITIYLLIDKKCSSYNGKFSTMRKTVQPSRLHWK